MRPLPIEAMAAAPAFVAGVALIRGVAVPVIDTGALLGASEPPAFTRFVTVRAGGSEVALAVEAVLGVRALAPKSLQRLPPLLQAGSDIVSALTALDSELLTVLKLARELTEHIVQSLADEEAA